MSQARQGTAPYVCVPHLVVHPLICGMLGAIRSLAVTRIPHPSLHTQLKLLCKLNVKAQAGLSSIRREDFYSTATPPQPPLFVSDHVALLTEIVPQLCRFGNAAATNFPGVVVQEVFWQLWMCLVFSARAVYAWQHTSISSRLWAPLHSLLSWLLYLTHSPPWLHMESGPGLASRNHELLLVLRLPMWCLRVINDAQEPEMSHMLASLPPDFITMLCCVACEHLEDLSDSGHHASAATGVIAQTAGAPASAVSARELYSGPIYTCHRFTAPNYRRPEGNIFNDGRDIVVVISKSRQKRRLASGPDTQVHPAFHSPAVLQLARMLLVQACKPCVEPDDLWFIVELNTSLVGSIFDAHLSKLRLQSPPLSGGRSNTACNSDHLTPVVDANAGLTPRNYMTDASLLQLLCSLATRGGPVTSECYRLIGMVCQSWSSRVGGNGLPLPGPVLGFSAVGASLCSLARQCSSHALQWIKAMLTERQKQRQALCTWEEGRLSTAWQNDSQPATAVLDLFSRGTMKHVQMVVILVCQISIQADMVFILGETEVFAIF